MKVDLSMLSSLGVTFVVPFSPAALVLLQGEYAQIATSMNGALPDHAIGSISTPAAKNESLLIVRRINPWIVMHCSMGETLSNLDARPYRKVKVSVAYYKSKRLRNRRFIIGVSLWLVRLVAWP